MGAGDLDFGAHGQLRATELVDGSGGSSVIPMHTLTLRELQLVKRQLDEELVQLKTNQQALTEAIARYKGSKTSLESFSEASLGSEVLVPLTGSIYIPGQLIHTKKVLVDIGTGYHVEKSIPEALKYFDKNIGTVSEENRKLTIIIQEKQKMLNLTNNYIQQKLANPERTATTEVTGLGSNPATNS